MGICQQRRRIDPNPIQMPHRYQYDTCMLHTTTAHLDRKMPRNER